MKRYILSFCVCLLISGLSYGQQTHFIFLQTENREPFYVTLDKKNYSSSSIGYLIVPKLVNGEYHLFVGFPKHEGTEQDYVLQVKDNDQGFLLKQFGDKGWGVFNMQSMAIQYAGEWSKKQTEEKERAAILVAAEAKRKSDALAKAEADSMAIVETKRRADALAKAVSDSVAAVEFKRKADVLAAAEERKRADDLAATEAKRRSDDSLAATLKQAGELAVAKQKADALAAALAKKRSDSLFNLQKANNIARAKREDSERLAILKSAKRKDSSERVTAAETATPLAQTKAKKQADSVTQVRSAKAAIATLEKKRRQDSIAGAKRMKDEFTFAENKRRQDSISNAKRLAGEQGEPLKKRRMDSLSELKRQTDAFAITEKKNFNDSVAEAKKQKALAAVENTVKPERIAGGEKGSNADSVWSAKEKPFQKPVVKIQVPAVPQSGNGNLPPKVTLSSSNDSVKIIEVVNKKSPSLINSTNADTGFFYRYVLEDGSASDTVTAFIKAGSAKRLSIDTTRPFKATEPGRVSQRASSNDGPVKFLDIDFKQDSSATTSQPAKEQVVIVAQVPATDSAVKMLQTNVDSSDNKEKSAPVTDTKSAPVNSVSKPGCNATATEKDFFNLRKKLASEESTDDMIMAAKKVMKEKCFSTEQIRNLSGLFLTDTDRYQFLDASYPFTLDPQNFESLAALLIDPYYKERFRAMIRR